MKFLTENPPWQIKIPVLLKLNVTLGVTDTFTNSNRVTNNRG